MIGGPAYQQVPTNTSTPPQSQAQAHSGANLLTPTASATTAGQSSNPSRHNYNPSPPDLGTVDPAIGGAMQTPQTDKKWLQLCIRASPDTFTLEEIDIGGRQTDHSVFKAIRLAYAANRRGARTFDRFAYRIPNGAVAVKVREHDLLTWDVRIRCST